MPALPPAPTPALEENKSVPSAVRQWYLGTRTRHYIMVRRAREVLSHAALEPGHRVLDAGCGWAFGALWARSLGCRVAGIDLDLDQLRWARTTLDRGHELGLSRSNARALPFRDRAFDRVVSVDLLDRVIAADRPRVFAEFARVLEPGGRIALSCANPHSPIDRNRRASGGSTSPISFDQLASGLESAGFGVLGSNRFLWVPRALPDAVLAFGIAAERAAELTPAVKAMGATNLIWAVRR